MLLGMQEAELVALDWESLFSKRILKPESPCGEERVKRGEDIASLCPGTMAFTIKQQQSQCWAL